MVSATGRAIAAASTRLVRAQILSVADEAEAGDVGATTSAVPESRHENTAGVEWMWRSDGGGI